MSNLSEGSGSSAAGVSTVFLSRVADAFDLSLTLLSCLLYVVGTYLEEVPFVQEPLWITEVCICAALLCLFIFRVVSSMRHGRQLTELLLSPAALLDVGTSAPVLLAVVFDHPSRQHSRSVRILRILRVLRTFSLTAEIQSQPIAQQAVVIALTIFSVVFIGACAFPLLEAVPGGFDGDKHHHDVDDGRHPYAKFPFHDSLYFVIITITTVGYGDIAPQSPQARFAALVMVASTFVLLPLQTSKLYELLTARDPFNKSFVGSHRRPHILLCGRISAPTLKVFHDQLLHTPRPKQAPLRLTLNPLRWFRRWRGATPSPEAAGDVVNAWLMRETGWGGGHDTSEQPFELQLVVLSSTAPDEAVRRLLQAQPWHARRIHWLRGSALSAHDLVRVDLQHAFAAVVLSEERPFADIADSDTRAVLDALSLRYRQPQLPCVVQLRRHAQAGHLRMLGTRCVLESDVLRQLILASCVLCPGASTLLANILQAIHGHEAHFPAHSTMAEWQLEYVRGARQRLQRMPVPPSLAGVLPATACLRAFREAGAVLLARIDASEQLELFPLCSSRPLQLGEALFVIRDPQPAPSKLERDAVDGASSPPLCGSGSKLVGGLSRLSSPKTLSLSSAFAAASARFQLPVRLRGQVRPSWEGSLMHSCRARSPEMRSAEMRSAEGSRRTPMSAEGCSSPHSYLPLPSPPRSPVAANGAEPPLNSPPKMLKLPLGNPRPPPGTPIRGGNIFSTRPLPPVPSTAAHAMESSSGSSPPAFSKHTRLLDVLKDLKDLDSSRATHASAEQPPQQPQPQPQQPRPAPPTPTPQQPDGSHGGPHGGSHGGSSAAMGPKLGASGWGKLQHKCNPLTRRLNLASALSKPSSGHDSPASPDRRAHPRGAAWGGGSVWGSPPSGSGSGTLGRRLSRDASVPPPPTAGTFKVSSQMLHRSEAEDALSDGLAPEEGGSQGAQGHLAGAAPPGCESPSVGRGGPAPGGKPAAVLRWQRAFEQQSQRMGGLDSPPPPPVDLRQHVILCGLPPHGGALRDFVASLRSRSHYEKNESCPAVVLLQPRPPSFEQWREACGLSRVYYVAGCRSDMGDMLRAGIERAAFMVIPRCDSMAQIGRRSEDHHALYEDAATILACREIESLDELQVGLAVEIAHASNIDFLLPHVADDEAARASSYGHTNPHLSPYFAAGRVLMPGTFSAMLCGAMRMSQLPELLDELLLGGAGGGCLLQWSIPPELECVTYAQLFEQLLTQYKAMAVGLLRGGREVSSPLPYVLTNPQPSTLVHPDDLVFVIGRPIDAMRSYS